MKASIIVPTQGGQYLKYLLNALNKQSIHDFEIVLVTKNCSSDYIKEFSGYGNLHTVIVGQKEGHFTHALNIGKKAASGDLLIFTDDDAIPPKNWIAQYLKLHHKNIGIMCICSRDVYIDLKTMRLLPTPDDNRVIGAYRRFIRPWLDVPHHSVKKYSKGVYITKKMEIAHGRCIPYKICYSLPFRGVNMSFKRESMEMISFPEHPLLRRGLGNEQHIGLQLILKGWESIYVPDNPTLHISHESLSRTAANSQISRELEIMKNMYSKLLNPNKSD